MSWQQLSLEAGAPLQLHAPGFPRALFSDGAALGWADTGGLYLLSDTAVAFSALPHITDLCVSPDRWVATTEDGRLHWGVPGADDWQHRTPPAGTLKLGSHWIIVHQALGAACETLSGEPVPLPQTASRALPFPDAPGACWTSAGTLYLLDDTGIQAIDAVPSPVSATLLGPAHTVLLQLKDGRVLASVGKRLLVELTEGATIEDGSISVTGDRALLRTEEGCALYDLRTGERLGTYEGVAPAALSPQVALLEEETGELLTPDGDLIFGGFLGAPALLSGPLLLGPGSGAWDLSTGTLRFSTPALAADRLLASSDTIYCIHDEEVGLFDRQTGSELRWLERPPGEPSVRGDTLLFVEGAQPGVEAPSPLLPDTAGLPVTHEVRLGGRLWQWNDAGLLISRSA